MGVLKRKNKIHKREVITMKKNYYKITNLTKLEEYHFLADAYHNVGECIELAIEDGLIEPTDKIQFCGKAVL